MALLGIKREGAGFSCYDDLFFLCLFRLPGKENQILKVFGLFSLTLRRTSNYVYLQQKRKVEAVPLVTQVPPAAPVPSLPSTAEASQASVFPAVRETNTFKAREDHEQLSSLTTVKKIPLGS